MKKMAKAALLLHKKAIGQDYPKNNNYARILLTFTYRPAEDLTRNGDYGIGKATIK